MEKESQVNRKTEIEIEIERNKLNDSIELPFQNHILFHNIIIFENYQLVVNFVNFDSE